MMQPEARRNRATAIAVCLALVGVGAASGTWVEVHSPNFTVVSDAGRKEAQQVAAEFEQFRVVYRTALPHARIDPGKPVIILAVKDPGTFQTLLPGYTSREGIRPSGIFAPGEERHYAAVQVLDAGPNPRRNLYHEYVHLMNRLNFRRLPAWLNEGLAEFYANTSVSGGSAEIGRPDLNHLRLVQTRPLLPLGRLLAVDHSAPEYTEKDRASIFYAQAWLLTHFLLLGDDPAYRGRLESLLDQFARGDSLYEAATQSLGPLPELEEKLSAYSRRISFRTTVLQTTSEVAETPFSVRELSPAQVKAIQGDFLLQTQRPVEARALLDEAVREDPQLTTPKESLGRLELLEGRRKEARNWFGKAIANDSRSYLVYYYFAMLTVEDTKDPEEIEIAEEHLERAIELNPGFAPACAALSGFYAVRPGMIHGALELARKAAELEPETLGFGLNVGNILLRMQRVEEAFDIGKQVLTRALTEKDRREARAFLETVRSYQAKLAEWKRIEDSARAAAEERKRRQAEAQQTESTPTARLRREPPQPQWGAGPKRRVYGSGVEGWIASVSCRGKTMSLALDVAAYRLNLRSINYYEIGFQTAGWNPPDDFNPCVHLKGRRAVVIYMAVHGKAYAGEILSIEVTQ
jgi:tetratricopeptide (TPR) repeat protein